MSESTQVVPATSKLPANVDLQADAILGRQTMGIKDVAIPFILVLQSLSPQVVKSSPKRIEGAEEGDFFNNVTEEVIAGSDGIIVVPCAYQRLNVEWMPRDSGGGFVQQHAGDEILAKCTRDERGYDRLPNGNLIVTTAYYYCLSVKASGYEPVVLSMARTQLKKARKWNAAMNSIQFDDGKGGKFNPPMFSHKYKITTVPEHKKDYNWMGLEIENLGPITDPEMYQAARKMAIDVSKGVVKATPPAEAGDEPVGDDIPF